jgi:uncharacterized protein YqgC (DUF456 family)
VTELTIHLILWLTLGICWLSTLVGAPGALLMLVAAVLYGWATGFREIGVHTLIWLGAIAVPIEALDQLLGFWAARRYGATWPGMAGAFMGGMIGAALLGSVLPLVGVVPGALIGSFVGAYAGEYATRRDAPAALRAAWGGFLGRIAGITMKMSAGLVMVWMIYRSLR